MSTSNIFENYYGSNAKKYAINDGGEITYKSLEELCDKFPAQYADLLKLTVPVIIDYLGTDAESCVVETLQNLEIAETQKGEKNIDVERRYGFDIESDDNVKCMVDKKMVNMAVGAYCSEPIIEETQGKYQLAGVKNLIIVKPLDYKYSKVSTFIHELLHAIKSQNNQCEILNDKDNSQYLMERSGLIHRLYSIDKSENGTIKPHLKREINIGIEEGINHYDEVCIMNSLLSIPSEEIPQKYRYIINNIQELPAQKDSGEYATLSKISRYLMQNDTMRKYIRNAQLYGEYEQCQTFFNRTVGSGEGNSWQNLNHNMDTVADLLYHMMEYTLKYSNDKEKMNEMYHRMENLGQNIGNIILKFLNGIKHNEELEK